MADGKVLIIDDEVDFTNALTERMEARGIKAVAAPNGEEGLRIAENENFDAVILDMVMPGMDGIETLARLMEKKPDLEVILLTGHGTIEKGVEAIKLGAKDFLEKPADVKELAKRIGEARARKIALVEKEAEERIKNILESKGW